jgi:transketolase
MRWPFAQALSALAARDPRVILLIGDVGGGLFSTFAREHPTRFINLGTAEQSMVGIAAGLALSGMRPVVYSFTPFLLERAFEQVKLDIAHHKAPVLLVGWEDETQGITHSSPAARLLIAANGLDAYSPETAADIARMIANPDAWPAVMLLKQLPK